jgi:hypothetical protein
MYQRRVALDQCHLWLKLSRIMRAARRPATVTVVADLELALPML